MCFMGVCLVRIYAMISIGNLAVALLFLGSMVRLLECEEKIYPRQSINYRGHTGSDVM